jgi:NADH-quinone oxidoreductase subunit A
LIEQFGRVGFLLLFAVAFPLIPIVVSFALGIVRIRPKKPDPVKESVYECGMVPVGTAQMRYNVRYYLFALLFVVFGVEVVFLYPWAVAYGGLGLFALVAGFIFIAILTLGYVYDWRKGAMEWI